MGKTGKLKKRCLCLLLAAVMALSTAPLFRVGSEAAEYSASQADSAETVVYRIPEAFENMKEETETLYYGDIDEDGEVTTDDALKVLEAIVKLCTLEGRAAILADVDKEGDGITAHDALHILRRVVGLEEKTTYTSYKAIGFPGADGFGKYATGGRGGKVYEVTDLSDSGEEGSLRWAVEAEGPRIVVFKVSGTIYLDDTLTIKNGDITIAGQTAPGDGICLANFGLRVSGTDNVIVRYLRVRPGDQGYAYGAEEDGIDVKASKNVIIDHCSASWAMDETLSVSPNGDGEVYDKVSDKVSVQWCMITESIRMSQLSRTRHGMGSLIRGSLGASVTYHHNFYASHSSRLPMTGTYMYNDEDDKGFNMEFVNNVVYNWASKKSGTCADADANGERIHTTYINYINNVFKKGPDSTGTYAFAEACIGNHMYIAGNMMEGQVPQDQKSLVCFEDDVLATDKNPYYKKSGLVLDQEAYFLDKPFAHSVMTGIQDSADAEKDVLAGVGASLNRDSVDKAMIEAYEKGEGRLIDAPSQSLGWENEAMPENLSKTKYYDWIQGKYPELKSYEGYADTDKDGMSDHWEEFMKLDPNDPADGAAQYKDSTYTNLDVFLQFLVENSRAAIKEN